MQTGGPLSAENQQELSDLGQGSVYGGEDPLIPLITAAGSVGVLNVPGVGIPIPLVSDVHITNRTVDKFAMGWLGGVGSDSQFQFEVGRLPVLPPANNRDLEQRINASRGGPNRDRLLTRYERPGNFNPGLGTDTWREGGQNVTWDMTGRGFTDPTTGMFGPFTYPAFDSAHRDAAAPFQPNRQGLSAVTAAPRVLVSSISGLQAGMSLVEMQKAANSAYTKSRVQRGMISRHHRNAS